MKYTSMTIVALVVATITAGAAEPALAQDAGDNRGPGMQLRGPGGEQGRFVHRGGPGEGMQMRVRHHGGGLFALVCSERGADRLEHMLLDIAQRTDPTAEQAPLYDALKDAALVAQADFAETCATARPAEGEAADRDLAERLKSRLDIQQAHLTAMSAVLPAFEAFYDSLSDEQKAAMEPRRQMMKHGMLEERGRPGAPQAPTPEGQS